MAIRNADTPQLHPVSIKTFRAMCVCSYCTRIWPRNISTYYMLALACSITFNLIKIIIRLRTATAAASNAPHSRTCMCVRASTRTYIHIFHARGTQIHQAHPSSLRHRHTQTPLHTGGVCVALMALDCRGARAQVTTRTNLDGRRESL